MGQASLYIGEDVRVASNRFQHDVDRQLDCSQVWQYWDLVQRPLNGVRVNEDCHWIGGVRFKYCAASYLSRGILREINLGVL